MDYWHRAGRCGLGHDNPIVGLRMIGYELIGGLYDNAYIFARTRHLMTGVIGFNSPVEHDHSVGLNTCLNLASEPLVETPLDAIKALHWEDLRQYTYKDG